VRIGSYQNRRLLDLRDRNPQEGEVVPAELQGVGGAGLSAVGPEAGGEAGSVVEVAVVDSVAAAGADTVVVVAVVGSRLAEDVGSHLVAVVGVDVTLFLDKKPVVVLFSFHDALYYMGPRHWTLLHNLRGGIMDNQSLRCRWSKDQGGYLAKLSTTTTS
jgi:hypothetical protein